MTISSPFHVVFLATTTEEKIRDLNIAATQKLLPLKFFNLNRLAGTLPNTIEDGNNASENADLKLKAVQDKIQKCRNNYPQIKQFCKERGITNISKNRIWFATEDSGVTIPQEIWSNIPEEVLGVLPDEVRHRLTDANKGPGVDTAPFLSATLGYSNINTIINSGMNIFARTGEYTDEQGQIKKRNLTSADPLLFKEESVVKLQPFIPKYDNKGKGERVLETRGEVFNEYADTPYNHPDSTSGRNSNLGIVKPQKRLRGKETAAELGVKYIAKYSSRAAVMDDLVKKINRYVPQEHALMPVKENEKNDLLFLGTAKKPDVFTVGFANISKNPDENKLLDALEFEGKHLQMFWQSIEEPQGKSWDDVKRAEHYLSYPERLLEKSDGIILLPDSARKGKPMDLEEKIYLLSSLVVAKQLIARDKEKPIAIINTDHSWDKALQIHKALADVHMTKDHTIPLGHQLHKINVTPNGYFSVLNGNESAYEDALKAAAYIMKDASLTYHPTPDEPSETRIQGNDSPYKKNSNEKYPINQVAIFCSASSENAPLNRLVSQISEKLVAAGKRIICGGGDRYTMGAILEGVKRHRMKEMYNQSTDYKLKNAYIAGISTHPIAASETNKGEISEDYSYRELSDNIYERMAKMMVPAEKIIVAPGGAGTIQEWMGFNLLKKKMPKLFANKELIIFDPDLMTRKSNLLTPDENVTQSTSLQNKVFDSTLDIIFGKDRGKFRLHKDFNHHRVYIQSTVSDVLQSCGVNPVGLAV